MEEIMRKLASTIPTMQAQAERFEAALKHHEMAAQDLNVATNDLVGHMSTEIMKFFCSANCPGSMATCKRIHFLTSEKTMHEDLMACVLNEGMRDDSILLRMNKFANENSWPCASICSKLIFSIEKYLCPIKWEAALLEVCKAATNKQDPFLWSKKSLEANIYQ
jgi:hypothetical protein